MDGEQNGAAQEEQNMQQQEGGQQAAQQPQPEGQGAQAGVDGNGADASAVDAGAYEAQIAERDARIGELEAQIAEAAKSVEVADGLREEIAALRKQDEGERVEFGLLLAGCRNVKAAKAVLEDHGGDIREWFKVHFYADATWALPSSVLSGTSTFYNCSKLVGGNGTAYSSSMTGYAYFRIDKSGQAGYLTAA